MLAIETTKNIKRSRNSLPDFRPHVTTASSEHVTCWAGCNRNDYWYRLVYVLCIPLKIIGLTRILVALKHHLCITGNRVPELNSTVLGTTHHPVSIRRKANTKHKILTMGVNIHCSCSTSPETHSLPCGPRTSVHTCRAWRRWWDQVAAGS